MEEERSGAEFKLEHERSGGGLREEEWKSDVGLGSIFCFARSEERRVGKECQP